MPMRRMLTALTLALALAAGAALADERAISLDEAVAQAERQYNARAIRAEEKRHGDRIEYRIRLLGEDGRVFEVRIDAGSGRRRGD
ncbi:MAG TPA: PepSY domain-containing protein [Steroidobacteraceae bacterium]